MLGRSTNGRFAMGNAGGPGNPLARRTGHIKLVLLDAVTDDDLRAIVKSLIEQAKAAELVFNRLLGKATAEPLAGDAEVELSEQEQAEQLAALRASVQLKLSRLPEAAQQRILDKLDASRNLEAQEIGLIDHGCSSKELALRGTYDFEELVN